jgi:putative oxidoreductase
LFHTNFAIRNELLHFEKDLAIAGGMFVLMLRGAGRYSVQTFAKQREAHEGGWQWRFRAF